MENKVKVALDRVMKARAELILTRTFYGVLVGQVTPQISEKFPTAATNGKVHYFNPDFVSELSQEELLGTQVHESEHDARRHGTRRLGRDQRKWNEACDYAINVDLVDEGFKLPKGALIDPKYRGMSAEDIYRSREIDEALERQKQEQEQAEDESDEDESEASDAGDDEADQDEGDESGEPDEGEPTDEAGDQEGDDGEGDGEGDEQESDEEGDGGNGENAESDEGDSEGDGNGGGEDADDEAEGSGGDAEGDDEGEGTGEGPAGADGDDEGEATGDGEGGDADTEADDAAQSSGDPGRCGEVLDSAETEAEIAEEDAKWETTLRQAASLAAKRGEAPGHMRRELERADHPPQDWREVLRAFFDGGVSSTETWARPNRRFIGGGLYLPGRQRDGINRCVFMVDTSGSVTYYPGALEAIQVETQAALDEGVIDEAVVLYGDAEVTRVDTYRNGDEIEFDPRGGGGTDLRPMFKYVADQIDDATLIVSFTDLEIGDPGPEPHCPVLWAVVGYPERVKEYLKKTPWDAQGIEVRPE